VLKLPDRLTDPGKIAEEVYGFWVQVMRTDGVEGVEEMPDWTDVPKDVRDRLVESLKNNVSEPILRFAQACESELRAANALFEKGDSLCYVCGKNDVSDAGRVCGSCYYTHVGGLYL
jgi:hypothetical protein